MSNKKILILFGFILTTLLIFIYMRRADPVFSAWQWDSVTAMSISDSNRVVSDAKKLNIKNLFVRIDDYVDIIEGSDKRSVQDFENSLSRFIKEANKNNISVEGLGGSVSWARSSHDYIPPLLIDFVVSYNKKYPDARLAGMQFDIEPYSLADYRESERVLLEEYFNLVKKITRQTTEINPERNLSIGFSIPPWYDGSRSDPVMFISRGVEKPLAFAMLDTLEEYGNGYLAVMSYRVRADGENGSIDISKKILDYAEEYTPTVKVWVGQETDKVDEEGISFFGRPAELFYMEEEKISSFFKKYKTFAGVAIHDLKSFVSLVNTK